MRGFDAQFLAMKLGHYFFTKQMNTVWHPLKFRTARYAEPHDDVVNVIVFLVHRKLIDALLRRASDGMAEAVVDGEVRL